MTPDSLPLIAWLSEASPGDPIFDSLMILGPILLLVVAIVGRTTATNFLVGIYVASFFVYVIYNGIAR